MAYTRVWVPELNAYKIIGEISGEEAAALSATIPEGSTQWGWGARSGTFAYGTSENSRIQTYTAPTQEVAPILQDRSGYQLDIRTREITQRPGMDWQGFRPQETTPVIGGGGQSGGGGASAGWAPTTSNGNGLTNLIIPGIGIFGALCLAFLALGKRK